jgi:hypothetical protein
MTADMSYEPTVASAYLEHLTDNDVDLLAGPELGPAPPRELRNSILSRRGGIEDLLASPRVFDAIFGAGREEDPIVRVSPFLVFAVALERALRKLDTATYVPEWAGIGRRALLFDVARLRRFAASAWHRLFLAELLASYTRVASGSVVVATNRGLRRHRFSDLDPVRLAGLLDLVPEAERPGILRRLGDLALFLTGVFPDYVARHGFGPVAEARLWRSGVPAYGGRGGVAPAAPNASRLGHEGGPALGHESAVALLERLGRRWYQAAFTALPRPVPASLAVLGELPESFADARRVLGLLTDTYLFPYRDSWFGQRA